MDAKPFDKDKACTTRDGRRVHHLHTFPNGMLTGFIGENQYPWYWTSAGRYMGNDLETPHDLVNVPTERTVWVNLYQDGLAAHFYATEECADAMAGSKRLADKAFKIEWEE